MNYKVRLAKQAEKEFVKIDHKGQLRISTALLTIQENPFVGKKLQGKYSGLWSHRVWPYRIIYEIRRNELIVVVLKIGHRQGVYR